jgi:hypothetical protein
MKTLLIGFGVLALAGCGLGEWAEKKANKALQDELKKESEKNASDDKADKKDGDKGDKAGSDSSEMWTETVTGSKIALTRVKLDDGGLAGMSILAPEGAKVAKSPGGRGADITEVGYGYAVWVTEDPTATMDEMKKAAGAWHKDATFENEDANSFIVVGKGLDGDAVYYYKGLFTANGKTYRCETQTSTAPSKKSHAEQVDTVCDSMQIGGEPVAAKGSAPKADDAKEEPAAEQKVADASGAPASKPGSQSAPAKASDPKKGEPPKSETKPAETAKAPASAKPSETAKAEKAKENNKKIGETFGGRKSK